MSDKPGDRAEERMIEDAQRQTDFDADLEEINKEPNEERRSRYASRLRDRFDRETAEINTWRIYQDTPDVERRADLQAALDQVNRLTSLAKRDRMRVEFSVDPTATNEISFKLLRII